MFTYRWFAIAMAGVLGCAGCVNAPETIPFATPVDPTEIVIEQFVGAPRADIFARLSGPSAFALLAGGLPSAKLEVQGRRLDIGLEGVEIDAVEFPGEYRLAPLEGSALGFAPPPALDVRAPLAGASVRRSGFDIRWIGRRDAETPDPFKAGFDTISLSIESLEGPEDDRPSVSLNSALLGDEAFAVTAEDLRVLPPGSIRLAIRTTRIFIDLNDLQLPNTFLEIVLLEERILTLLD